MQRRDLGPGRAAGRASPGLLDSGRARINSLRSCPGSEWKPRVRRRFTDTAVNFVSARASMRPAVPLCSAGYDRASHHQFGRNLLIISKSDMSIIPDSWSAIDPRLRRPFRSSPSSSPSQGLGTGVRSFAKPSGFPFRPLSLPSGRLKAGLFGSSQD